VCLVTPGPAVRQGSTGQALADLPWPDIGGRVTADGVLAVPLGATEQHGPHLPLSTDTDIAVALCQRLAAARTDVLIAPPVAYGSSGEHQDFPGTLSIGQEAVELLLVELGRSASRTFAHLVFVCAHGGNAEPAARSRAVARRVTGRAAVPAGRGRRPARRPHRDVPDAAPGTRAGADGQRGTGGPPATG